MRISLVAMPWARTDLPSAALGSLAAYLRERAPEVEVSTHHAFLDLYGALGGLYDWVAFQAVLGERLYAVLVHQSRQQRLLDELAAETDEGRGPPVEDASGWAEAVLGVADRHATVWAERLAGSADLVGFTTTFCQLFASLLVARRLKRLDPGVRIVLGGDGVGQEIGPSVLRHYPFIDDVVQGEGELRLLRLVQAMERGETTRCPGVLGSARSPRAEEEETTSAVPDRGCELLELDALPLPDFSEFAERADEMAIPWMLPTEGSRGCWHNRVARTGDPLDACAFCSLSAEGPYRMKSSDRLAREMAEQGRRYNNVRHFFMDTVLRNRGVSALTEAIERQPLSFVFAYELRATVRPIDLLRIAEAGCCWVQLGIEGLSSSYLKRINKGTTVLRNLQAMKLCQELRIECGANLITHFPGSTDEEVAETVRVIERAALSYPPPTLTRFHLDRNSAVHRRPEHFGVRNIRALEAIRTLLPEELRDDLELPWLSFDEAAPGADWGPVIEAHHRWVEFHRGRREAMAHVLALGELALHYNDGGSFLEIVDVRQGAPRLVTVEGLMRDLYLECCKIKSFKQLTRTFVPSRTSEDDLRELLGAYVEADLMFEERDRYLSLAPARRPDQAAARIRREAEADRRG